MVTRYLRQAVGELLARPYGRQQRLEALVGTPAHLRALELAARLHAARAASAAAAASLMTLGLPIAASAWARSTIIPATLMTWAGGQAALASA